MGRDSDNRLSFPPSIAVGVSLTRAALFHGTRTGNRGSDDRFFIVFRNSWLLHMSRSDSWYADRILAQT
jgi:hypothetical protein